MVYYYRNIENLKNNKVANGNGKEGSSSIEQTNFQPIWVGLWGLHGKDKELWLREVKL